VRGDIPISVGIFAALSLLAGSAGAAVAWEQERYRSGMSMNELQQVTGLKEFRSFPVANRKDQWVTSHPRLPKISFTFCRAKLSEIQFTIEGGFRSFTGLVQSQKHTHGEPQFEVVHHSVLALLRARWVANFEEVELLYQEDHRGEVSVAKNSIDLNLARVSE
jgi:hypothetical protein